MAETKTTTRTKKGNGKTAPTGIFGTGKRKESIARVKLHVEKGQMIVNEKPIVEYFPGDLARYHYLRAFQVLDLNPIEYNVSIKVAGGGKNGQLSATAHAIAKALLDINPEFRLKLKKAGLLHRDARVKERRKYGLAGKARADKQRPKR